MTASSGPSPVGVRFSRHVRHLVGELWSVDADRAVSAAELIAACDDRPTSLVDLASALANASVFSSHNAEMGQRLASKTLVKAAVEIAAEFVGPLNRELMTATLLMSAIRCTSDGATYLSALQIWRTLSTGWMVDADGRELKRELSSGALHA